MSIANVINSQAKAREVAEATRNYAFSHSYTGAAGAAVGGCYFAGWPLPALLDAALAGFSQQDKNVVGDTIRSMYVPLAVDSEPGPSLYSFEAMLAMRMRWGFPPENTWAPGFSHVAIHKSGDTILVWVVSRNGGSVVLEDESSLFPSDALVTKLNLMSSGG